MSARVTSAIRAIRTYLRNPRNPRVLGAAYQNLKPVFRQLMMSGYVFMFKLPWPLSSIVGHLGDFWFYRLLVNLSAHRRPDKRMDGPHAWDMVSSLVGPSDTEVAVPGLEDEAICYPVSVKSRVSTGGYAEKIRLYRDGLALGRWEKSAELLLELNQIKLQAGGRPGRFSTGPPGSFGAPVTMLWGQKDVACNETIAMEGVGDYFGVSPSHYIIFPKVGHWTPHDSSSVEVWEAVINWALEGEQEAMEKVLEGYEMAKLVIES
jgi:pimeloyl-ACP methyl ester carboxylesterase